MVRVPRGSCPSLLVLISMQLVRCVSLVGVSVVGLSPLVVLVVLFVGVVM